MTFIAKDVIENTANREKRSGDQNPENILSGKGQNGRSRTQKVKQRVHKDKSQDGDEGTYEDGVEATARRIGLYDIDITSAKLSGDIATGTMTEHEADGLVDCH